MAMFLKTPITIIDLDPPILEKFAWFLTFPRRKRSKRKTSNKNADRDAGSVSKQENKIESVAVSKGDEKLGSRSSNSHRKASVAVSKGDKKLGSRSSNRNRKASVAVSKGDKKLGSRSSNRNRKASVAVSKCMTKLGSRASIIHKDANVVPKINQKLDSGTFECYLENLWQSFSEDQRTCFTYIDSLWFSLYMKESQRSKVLSWINKKRIFTKKYVFVPIVCWSHWSLLIMCHFGESLQSETRTTCMLLLDSLQDADPRRLEPDIRKFIFDIYQAEGRPETGVQIRKIPLLVPKVPQQRDGEECGSFVLYYINLFVEGAPEEFNMKGYPYFMGKSWFTREGLECFCKRLDSFPK